MLAKSRKHLVDNGERYFEHQRFALRYAWGCVQAAAMAATHAFVPAWFETAASEKVKALATRKRDE